MQPIAQKSATAAGKCTYVPSPKIYFDPTPDLINWFSKTYPVKRTVVEKSAASSAKNRFAALVWATRAKAGQRRCAAKILAVYRTGHPAFFEYDEYMQSHLQKMFLKYYRSSAGKNNWQRAVYAYPLQAFMMGLIAIILPVYLLLLFTGLISLASGVTLCFLGAYIALTLTLFICNMQQRQNC